MSTEQQTKQQKNALRHVGATAPPAPKIKEEDKEQYKKICDDEECDTILDINTHIMCYMNKRHGDKTLCRVCYEDDDYQDDDENSDNEEEVAKCPDSYSKHNKCPIEWCCDCDDAREEEDTFDQNCYENHTECCGSGLSCEEPITDEE